MFFIYSGQLPSLVGLTTGENGVVWGKAPYAKYATSIKLVTADGSNSVYANECSNQILELNRSDGQVLDYTKVNVCIILSMLLI